MPRVTHIIVATVGKGNTFQKVLGNDRNHFNFDASIEWEARDLYC